MINYKIGTLCKFLGEFRIIVGYEENKQFLAGRNYYYVYRLKTRLLSTSFACTVENSYKILNK